MTFRKLFIDHERDPEVDAWIAEETREQEQRFETIAQQMDEMKPTRARWYQEFFDRIMNRGFNVDADDKMPIPPAGHTGTAEGREDRVVWKYGVDGELKKGWENHEATY